MITISSLRFVQIAFIVVFAELSSSLINAQDSSSTELVYALKNGDARSVAAAIAALPNNSINGKEIVGQLTLLLNDERTCKEHLMGRETVRERAWFRMLDLQPTSVQVILTQVANLKSTRARGLALEVIAQIGKIDRNAFLQILDYCHDDDVYVRSRAVSALNSVGDDSSTTVEQFGKLLTDSDPMVRSTVLDALEKRHEHLSVLIPAIIELLDDDSVIYIAISNHAARPEKLRGHAARLLAKIGPDAVKALPKLKALTEATNATNVRVWAATAICKITDPPPPVTLQLLGDLLLVDMDREFVQNDAPKAIAELGKMAAPLLEHLERAKKHSAAQIRWGLVDAFFALDPPSAVRRVLPMMDDKEELVAETVITAFSSRGISERVVIDAYILALGNHDGSFDQPASSAVDALAKLGAAARLALPALERLSLEPDISDSLRKDVTLALARIR